ncbi:MAG: PDZ domain-containing protein, partial [Pseudobdellovibrionaceae bacterium]
MKLLAICLVLASALTAGAQTTGKTLDAATKTKLQQEIDYVGNLYGTVYAPKAWKESHLGWNLPAQVVLAQTKLAAARTMTEARQAVADLINSTADYHVSFSFYSTEKATLPFQIKTVQGKSLIVYIDRTKLSEAAFPFKTGDELLTMDQMPVSFLQHSIVTAIGNNVPETDQALADLMITRRSGSLQIAVPHGPVTLSVKRASDDTVGTVTLTWDYMPEQLAQKAPFRIERPAKGFFNRQMVGSKAMPFVDNSPQAENTFSLGVKKPFLPNFGERIWETAADN